jgi:hypothetical protein
VNEFLATYRTELEEYEREFLADVVIEEPFRPKLTCVCVPEQWDIFIDDRLVGYLRCRHSKWDLRYPNVAGEILIAEPWHPERGEYESNFDEERPAVFERVFRALSARLLSPDDLARSR